MNRIIILLFIALSFTATAQTSIEKPKSDSAEAEITPPPKPDEKKVTLIVSVFNDHVVMKNNERETNVNSNGTKFSDKEIGDW